MKEIELEKTYLAHKLPDEIKQAQPIDMLDVYFPKNSLHPVLRLRKNGSKYTLTKKYPLVEGDSSTMIEETIVLTREEFDVFATLEGKRVAKDRYKVNIGGFPAEVDVFKEALKGLVLIDFEFKNQKDKKAFKIPQVALADVTQEEYIAGGFLAGKSYADIEDALKKYEYKKL